MNQLFDFFVENWQALVSGAGSFIGFVAGSYAAFSAKALKSKLRKASERGTYVVCPHCKKAIKLSDVPTFYLPDGSIDNDLDGKAD